MWDWIRNRVTDMLTPTLSEQELKHRLNELRQRAPVPVFWLFGKTQTGKSSIIKFLTGADAAEIGNGFKPCTKHSRLYHFPTADAPLMAFLDTRGVDEPGYDPAEDLAQFDNQAHLMIVTVKATDHAQLTVLENLKRIRASRSSRPVLLVVTCLHEVYPQQQHPQPYPFAAAGAPVLPELARCLDEHRRRFDGLIDMLIPIDLTLPEEGYEDPNYGGEYLRAALMERLPDAQAQTFRLAGQFGNEVADLYARRAEALIRGYAITATSAGAIPVPFVDMVIIAGVQAQMVNHLAQMYGQPLNARRFMEVASTLGLGIVARQAARELTKVIPGVGSVVAGALAGASTYALGKAFCFYYRSIHSGHTPNPEDLKKYYQEQLKKAEAAWKAATPSGGK